MTWKADSMDRLAYVYYKLFSVNDSGNALYVATDLFAFNGDMDADGDVVDVSKFAIQWLTDDCQSLAWCGAGGHKSGWRCEFGRFFPARAILHGVRVIQIVAISQL